VQLCGNSVFSSKTNVQYEYNAATPDAAMLVVAVDSELQVGQPNAYKIFTYSLR